MRAGLSTIQQTLTPEASTVLNHAISEAGRRNHGQTTPLHVAATLLSSPTGLLRQACIKSHPNSSHPLQCRALELCFSVALERLPTAQAGDRAEPPISNALMAALKRAQAHQRRGCPEQQQQPLLAVKVELEQLIISILDDPSVSRVMREASFSSPAVKASLEQSLSTPSPSTTHSNSNINSSSSNNLAPVGFGIGFRPSVTGGLGNRNLYLNPRLQQQQQVQQQGGSQSRGEELKRVVEILSRGKKRNPVLVGESEPEIVVREILRKIKDRELSDGGMFKNVEVIHLDKDFSLDRNRIPDKIKELGVSIESQIRDCVDGGGGVIVDLGDLKWLVEQPVNSVAVAGAGGAAAQQVIGEAGRAAVEEMRKLLVKFGERIWLIGTATCETYLRCQVYHNTMENDWDLQAVPIAARAPLPGMFPRLGSNGTFSSSLDSLSPLKNFPISTNAFPKRSSENLDPVQKLSCCPQCTEGYEKEMAETMASGAKSNVAAKPVLPQWLQNTKVLTNDVKSLDQQPQDKDEDLALKKRTQELQEKWRKTCLHLHPNVPRGLGSERISPSPVLMTGLCNPNLVARQPFQPKLQTTLQLKPSLMVTQPSERVQKVISPPGSPVRTDLVLGPTKTPETLSAKPDTESVKEKDLLGCISSTENNSIEMQANKLLSALLDADSFKRLLKGLKEKVWWQTEAASAVATTVTQCKAGNSKRQGMGVKSNNIWMLFTGPDRVGKKKIAAVLSELTCGVDPIIISFSSRSSEDMDTSFRGKTALDRIGEAVRRNPFSVIMLDDIDDANMLIRGSLKQAIERGRLADSHGREISLGNVIFILSSNFSTSNCRSSEEQVLAKLSSEGCQLRLTMSGKTGKRRANWLTGEDRPTKPRKEMNSTLSFDLNLNLNSFAGEEIDRTDGSLNSSDLTTVDHEDESGLPPISQASREFAGLVDDAIAFKAIDFGMIQQRIASALSTTFSSIIHQGFTLDVQEEALEKISGGILLGRSKLEDWLEEVLVPSLHELQGRVRRDEFDEPMVIRLESDTKASARGYVDVLPSQIIVAVDG